MVDFGGLFYTRVHIIRVVLRSGMCFFVNVTTLSTQVFKYNFNLVGWYREVLLLSGRSMTFIVAFRPFRWSLFSMALLLLCPIDTHCFRVSSVSFKNVGHAAIDMFHPLNYIFKMCPFLKLDKHLVVWRFQIDIFCVLQCRPKEYCSIILGED